MLTLDFLVNPAPPVEVRPSLAGAVAGDLLVTYTDERDVPSSAPAVADLAAQATSLLPAGHKAGVVQLTFLGDGKARVRIQALGLAKPAQMAAAIRQGRKVQVLGEVVDV